MKPKMIAVTKIGECITQARCSLCTFLINGPSFFLDADTYNRKMNEVFEKHVAKKHSREDVNQAAARIVRESTE
jgi:hypothetical protein